MLNLAIVLDLRLQCNSSLLLGRMVGGGLNHPDAVARDHTSLTEYLTVTRWELMVAAPRVKFSAFSYWSCLGVSAQRGLSAFTAYTGTHSG